jgi:hypothetical protein
MVKEWLTKKPDAAGFLRAYGDSIDWAIVPTDTCVLDIEMKNGLDGCADLASIGMQHLLVGAHTRTKSGGFHLWFKQPASVQLTGGFHILPGVEAKARNGSVHIPPSNGYIQIHAIENLKEMPPILVDMWQAAAKKRDTKEVNYGCERYPMGQRRQRMCSMAGYLRAGGLVADNLIAALLSIRDTHCEDPSTFTDQEVIEIAKDYAKRPARSEPDCSWFPRIKNEDRGTARTSG